MSAPLQAPAPRRPIALLRKRRPSAQHPRGQPLLTPIEDAASHATSSASPSTSTMKERAEVDVRPVDVDTSAQASRAHEPLQRVRPCVKQRRSASPLASEKQQQAQVDVDMRHLHHLRSGATTTTTTPATPVRNGHLSVPIATPLAASASSLEEQPDTPRGGAPLLQWVSSPIPRHWTLNPLARGRTAREQQDVERSQEERAEEVREEACATVLLKHL